MDASAEPLRIPWHRRLWVRLVALMALLLGAVTAVNLGTSRTFLCAVSNEVALETSRRIEELQREATAVLDRGGEAVVESAAREIFHRQLLYLASQPGSRAPTSARALVDFCVGDAGWQRMVNRRFLDHGYSNASIVVGPALVAAAHARRDLLGRDLFEVNAGLSAEDRRAQRADVFEEHWKDRRSGGIFYEQTPTYRPAGLPEGWNAKYAYQVWGEHAGIPMVVEITTYIDEFRRPARDLGARHQEALAGVQALTETTARDHALRLVWLTLLVFVLGVAVTFLLHRSLVARPVQALVEGLQAFARGELSRPLRTDAGHELAEVEAISNDMARRLDVAMTELRDLNASLERRVTERTEALEATSRELLREKEQGEALLRNVLPAAVADRLRGLPDGFFVDDYASVSVLFTDFKGFTTIAGAVTPERLIRELDAVFAEFDALARAHRMEKIKTIGDAYFAVGGCPERNATHPHDAVALGLAMRDAIAARRLVPDALPFEIRVGIHTGPVVAGVIGRSRIAFDLWGDTVNMASRMESHGEPGRVNVSEATWRLVRERFRAIPRGLLPVKGKGEIEMFFVDGELDRPATA